MSKQVPASVRYKELTALAADAAEKLRQHETAKAAELAELVDAEAERLEQAEAQRDDIRADVRNRWNAALHALWDERWLEIPGMPEPDPSAPPLTPQECRKALHEASQQFHHSLDKQRFTPTALLPRRRKRAG
ncbi:hypothetical protein [Saccharopolyspora rectivirgula]|uniref:Uncharacterized protein n=1 Tax=Saccharopolyspora rectivirgula TaxID=28042 RepID=A0A073B2I1_9PSEU|nr:hypothetical protein [Saccharopolyspora rectivirgula]KEI45492.1 hypothetical protein GU90_03345 [Saccharopolyspora rectivirgula]